MSSTVLLARSDAQDGVALLDQYSPAHFVLGAIAGALGVDPHKAMMLFIGVKILDAAVRHGTGHAFFGREEGQSLGNELSDVVLETLGVFVGAKLRNAAELTPGDPAPGTAGLGSLGDRLSLATDWLSRKFAGHPGVEAIVPNGDTVLVKVNGFTPGVIPDNVYGVPVMQVVVSQEEGMGAVSSSRLFATR